jgi:N-dimethylarginine dimethylaminohydrolase
MKILMAKPTGFQVKDVQNPHMYGNVGKVDNKLAMQQWKDLVRVLDILGVDVDVIESYKHPDAVFAANCGLVDTSGIPGLFVLSNMVYPSRQKERTIFRDYFRNNGYSILEINKKYKFEGQGDCIWHPNKYILFAGYGFRTDLGALFEIQKVFRNLSILPLKLKHPAFYHLDTCFCPITDNTVMIVESAFDENALKSIHDHFKTVIKLSADDANNFACNAIIVNDSIVLNKGISKELKNRLAFTGFNTFELELSEFMKSGGSAACMVIKV